MFEIPQWLHCSPVPLRGRGWSAHCFPNVNTLGTKNAVQINPNVHFDQSPGTSESHKKKKTHLHMWINPRSFFLKSASSLEQQQDCVASQESKRKRDSHGALFIWPTTHPRLSKIHPTLWGVDRPTNPPNPKHTQNLGRAPTLKNSLTESSKKQADKGGTDLQAPVAGRGNHPSPAGGEHDAVCGAAVAVAGGLSCSDPGGGGGATNPVQNPPGVCLLWTPGNTAHRYIATKHVDTNT